MVSSVVFLTLKKNKYFLKLIKKKSKEEIKLKKYKYGTIV
ncbi:hypothetical protein QY97_01357 [Bacillus thermotolerans]|uniref:Uncharacterized protein n=1 Tax=Bacillus thermotolerans TaxID=1221996 RepID=A0A0F5HRD2_BACTR|nr:hypothetical protein QY95_03418 [Bacillus thermotolerans]KKB36089.1 hypothetical protein QY97_01357 [Bacillus thermotolerans]